MAKNRLTNFIKKLILTSNYLKKNIYTYIQFYFICVMFSRNKKVEYFINKELNLSI